MHVLFVHGQQDPPLIGIVHVLELLCYSLRVWILLSPLRSHGLLVSSPLSGLVKDSKRYIREGNIAKKDHLIESSKYPLLL